MLIQNMVTLYESEIGTQKRDLRGRFPELCKTYCVLHSTKTTTYSLGL